MVSNRKFCLFIPTYQVASTIGGVLAAIPKEILNQIGLVLIVDNGSTDETLKIVREFVRTQEHGKFRVLSNSQNYFLGGSTIIAFKIAIAEGYEHVICMHSDGQASPTELSKFMELARPDVDFIFGSRLLAQSRVENYSLLRLVGNRVFVSLQKWILKSDVRDIGAFICFNMKTISSLPYFKIPHDMSYQPLLVLTTFRLKKVQFIEFPISWGTVGVSHVNPITYGLTHLRRLMLMGLGLFPQTSKSLDDFRFQIVETGSP